MIQFSFSGFSIWLINSYEYIWIFKDNCLLVELFGLAGAQWFFYILSQKNEIFVKQSSQSSSKILSDS